jgi:hypothetical protein
LKRRSKKNPVNQNIWGGYGSERRRPLRLAPVSRPGIRRVPVQSQPAASKRRKFEGGAGEERAAHERIRRRKSREADKVDRVHVGCYRGGKMYYVQDVDAKCACTNLEASVTFG